MKRRVRLIFPQHLIKEPVIFTMAKNYDVIPNIRRARVTDTTAEMVQPSGKFLRVRTVIPEPWP